MTPITAAQQFKAIAYLRWCLFKNGFRRKGGTGELIARILAYPVGAAFVLGPTVGATIASYFAVSTNHLEKLSLVFWGIFILQVLISIQISAPGQSFDPEALIRFPLSFPRFLVVRIFLGLLSVSTIASTLSLLGAATGITVAQPSLAPVAFSVALALALANMFFVRMVFAWVDRWLATRRARELFTGLIIFFSIGIQYLNFTFNPGFNHGHRNAAKLAAARHAYGTAQPVLRLLPPSLGGAAVATGTSSAAALDILGILFFTALFVAVFAWRMHREFRGENLSEANNSPVLALPTPAAARPAPARAALPPLSPSSTPSRIPSTVAACLYKEWIYLRRNTAQFYGLLAPIAMVFLFTLRMGAHMSHSPWLFPAAVAYSVLGIAALAYNSFGLDGAGIQFYFLAPVHIGQVLFAKNLFSFALSAAEVVVIYALVTYTAGAPPALTLLSTVCWAAFALLVNLTMGNWRSLTAPKKMDPSKLSRKQASQLSALISLGLTLVVIALGGGTLLAADFLGLPWLPIPIFAALAVGAAFFYRLRLQSIDTLALRNRETMIEELCKAS